MAAIRVSMAGNSFSIQCRRDIGTEIFGRWILECGSRQVLQAQGRDRSRTHADGQSLFSVRLRSGRWREEVATQGPREAWRDTVGEEKEGESSNFVIYFDYTYESR